MTKTHCVINIRYQWINGIFPKRKSTAFAETDTNNIFTKLSKSLITEQVNSLNK